MHQQSPRKTWGLLFDFRMKITLRNRAFQYLARRDYSRAELRHKLLAHAEDEVALDALLDNLTEQGYLSDTRAAEQLVRNSRQRYGSQRITQQLRQKGIDDELVQETMADLKSTELDTARAVWQKKFGEPAQDDKEKARQMRFLLSRGFPLDVVFKVLRLEHD